MSAAHLSIEPTPVLFDGAGQPVALGRWGGGGYAGASTVRRALREWMPRLGSADSDSVPDLEMLRTRARDAERNEPLGAGAIGTLVNSTVGWGLTPHPRIDRDLLGLTEEEADAWESNAQRIWAAMAETTALDLQRRHTFAELQRMVYRSTLNSGDTFALRRFRQDADTLLGLRLQLVEADRVSNPHGRLDTPTLVAGIEFDRDGVPTIAHIRSRHPGDVLGWSAGGSPDVWEPVAFRGAQSGELQLLHVADTQRVGQTRGVPYLAPVLEKLKQLSRLSENELMAAVVSSLFTVFVTRPDVMGEGGPAPLASVNAGGVGVAAPGDAGLLDRQLRLGNGLVAELGPGERIEMAKSERPNALFDPFFEALAGEIGSAIQVPRELLLKAFTSSYSASRAALLEFWRSVRTHRSWLIPRFCQPVYEMVLVEAVSRGLLDAPGFFSNPLLRRAWCYALWTGPTQGQIDPRSEVEASALSVREGFSTLEEETAKLTGASWEENHVQQAKERRWRQRDGLSEEPVAERIVTEPKTPVEPETAEDAAARRHRLSQAEPG